MESGRDPFLSLRKMNYNCHQLPLFVAVFDVPLNVKESHVSTGFTDFSTVLLLHISDGWVRNENRADSTKELVGNSTALASCDLRFR